MPEQKCRICGCTENDCSQCIHKTGFPCHWVELDLCSACVEPAEQIPGSDKVIEQGIERLKQNIPSTKNNDMNFFEQLAALGNVDMTIRIMQKNDKMTLNIMPGSGSSTTKPLLFTGTAAELDEEFFKTITPAVEEVKGLISNMDDVKKNVSAKSDDEDDDADKTVPAKKEKAKPKEVIKPKSKKSTKPEPQPTALFLDEVEEKETEKEEAVSE